MVHHVLHYNDEERRRFWGTIAGFYRDKSFCDLELHCGSVFEPNSARNVIQCHKMVMASVSKFLGHVLRLDPDSREVYVPDFEYAEVKRLVDEVYGHLSNWGNVGFDDVLQLKSDPDLIRLLDVGGARERWNQETLTKTNLDISLDDLFSVFSELKKEPGIEKHVEEGDLSVVRGQSRPRTINKKLPIPKAEEKDDLFEEMLDEDSLDQHSDSLVYKEEEESDGDFNGKYKYKPRQGRKRGKKPKPRSAVPYSTKRSKLSLTEDESGTSDEENDQDELEEDTEDVIEISTFDQALPRKIIEECCASIEDVTYSKDFHVSLHDNKEREVRSKLRRYSYFRAIVGVTRGSQENEVLGRPLAWSDPTSDNIGAQFEDTCVAFQSLYGFSDSDLYFKYMIGTRQGFHARNFVHVTKNQLLNKHRKRSEEENMELLEDENVISVNLRNETKPFNCCLSQNKFKLTLKSDLDKFDLLIVLVWHAAPKEIWCSPIEVLEANKESSDMCMKTLFDVWMTSSKKIPHCQGMLKKFKSVAELAMIPETIKKFLAKEDYPQRQCPECGEMFQGVGFSQRNRYHYHMLSHKIEKFQCNCNLSFAGKTEKQRHVMLQHSDGRYSQCEQCPFVGTKHIVQKHMREDHQQYICDICGAVSKNKGTYYAHRRYHKSYRCLVCDMSFTGHKTLKAHKAEVHGIDMPKSWPCDHDECSAVFTRKTSLTDHKKRMHTSDESKAHHCEFCGKGFIKRSVLEVHRMSVHIKARPFHCRFKCGATFNSTGGRSIHERTIHGELFTPKSARQINPAGNNAISKTQSL